MLDTFPTGELWVIKTKQYAGLIGESLRVRAIADMFLVSLCDVHTRRVLNYRVVRELVFEQGTTALSSTGPVWLLGSRYGGECTSLSTEVRQGFLSAWEYRYGT